MLARVGLAAVFAGTDSGAGAVWSAHAVHVSCGLPKLQAECCTTAVWPYMAAVELKRSVCAHLPFNAPLAYADGGLHRFTDSIGTVTSHQWCACRFIIW